MHYSSHGCFLTHSVHVTTVRTLKVLNKTDLQIGDECLYASILELPFVFAL